MTHPASPDVTQILLDLGSGGGEHERREKSNQLFGVVYGELHRIAGNLMRRERPDHTLQPTALVHEVYLRLVDQTRTEWKDRAHFYGVAARAMRHILVDHARRYRAQKRGGDWHRVTLDEDLEDHRRFDCEILALHDALERLAQDDERMARVVELRIFAGMTSREVAHVLGFSKRTVDSDWKVAKMWLGKELSERDR